MKAIFLVIYHVFIDSIPYTPYFTSNILCTLLYRHYPVRTKFTGVILLLTVFYRQYLAPGAPFEINIDSKTMEVTLEALKDPSR